jgi:hypothetical protein
MANKRRKHAVSEIVGTVMLLGMAIAMFSIVNLLAFSVLPENENPPSVRLVASIDDEVVYVVHHGGESLPLDTKILIIINDDFANTTSINASENLIQSDSGSLEYWDISEKFVYGLSAMLIDIEYSPGDPVLIMVVDISSNSLIMSATIQEKEI